MVAAILAAFGAQVLITRTLGASPFGIVTVATQAALVLGFAGRFGMDMAAVRRVAIDVGQGERGRVRTVVSRAALIAIGVSLAVGAAVFAAAPSLARAFVSDQVADGTAAFRAAAVAIPFAALVQVYLGGTRGLKIMRHTLFIFWLGQPLAWLGLMALGWLVARTVGMTVLAYAGSWALATALAALVWRRETRGFGHEPAHTGEVRDLVRYGAPRAPAALFSQLLFWTDLFVLSLFASSDVVGVYAAAVRVAQVILLFLVSVNLMFSPFVADLHARGERLQLDRLFKQLTRWTLTATLPVVIVLAVAPGSVLRLFGGGFEGSATALLILLAGQLVNVATGSVGFILIMVGRTGWDLAVYGGSVLLSVGASVALIAGAGLGMEGAAIAGAFTLAASNLARLGLVWRFLRIQPFTRHYARLVWPALAAVATGVLAHLGLRGAAWPVDLGGTGLAVIAAYAAVLVAVGLPPGERRALASLVSGLRRTDRREGAR
jgi:O-antigen/teichoic acid export membrane protein